MHRVEKMDAQLRYRAIAEFAVAHPAGEQLRVERTFGRAGEELAPLDLALLRLCQARVPERFATVAALFDAGELAEYSRAIELLAAGHLGSAAHLGAHLADDVAGLDSVVTLSQALHVASEGFLADGVLARLGGGFEVRRVLVIAGGDHDGVDVVQRGRVQAEKEVGQGNC